MTALGYVAVTTAPGTALALKTPQA